MAKPVRTKPTRTRKSGSSVDYTAIAAQRVQAAGDSSSLPRYLIYGRNKKGKSWFGASATESKGPLAGNMLVMDPDLNGEELAAFPGVDLWKVYKWEDVNEFYRYTMTRECQEKYRWLNIDGLTRLNNMALRFVGSQAEERDLDRIPGMIDRRDYAKAGELLKGMLFNFHTTPYGIIYTAQEKTDRGNEEDDEEDDIIRQVPDLPPGVRSAVNSIVTGIGRMYTIRVDHPKEERKVTVRRLYIGQNERFDTGFRSKYPLPDYLKKPTVPRLMELLATGKVK